MFPNFTLTKDGEILLNSCIGARKTITFTRIKLGKGDLGIEEIRDMKDIVQSFKEIPILETQVLENKMTKIVSFFDNKDLKEDVLWKEIGVFAQIGEQTETEILYSYSNAGEEGVLIPSNERSTSFRRTLDLRNYIGYATDISFVINEIKDHYQFNTLSEMKVATYLKKGDKVSLWGDTVIGNKELRLYIVQEEEAEVELSNGLYAKLYLDESLKQNIEDKRLNTEDKTIVGAINEKLNQGTVPTTLNSAEKIVAALQATTGLKFDPNKLYLNDPGINEEGFCYLDRLRDGIFKCLVRNEDGVNDSSKFRDISNKASADRLDNLIKYEAHALGDTNTVAYAVFKIKISIPNGYRIVACVCSGRIDTNSISSAEIWTKLETSISYSWKQDGTIEVALLQNASGQRRAVDIITVLTKL